MSVSYTHLDVYKRQLLDRYHPQYMLHGHIHLNYGASIPREHTYGTTRIVNCLSLIHI